MCLVFGFDRADYLIDILDFVYNSIHKLVEERNKYG